MPTRHSLARARAFAPREFSGGRNLDTKPQSTTSACCERLLLFSPTSSFQLASRLFRMMTRLESRLPLFG